MANGVIDFSLVDSNGIPRGLTYTDGQLGNFTLQGLMTVTDEGLLLHMANATGWTILPCEGSETTGDMEALLCFTEVSEQNFSFSNVGQGIAFRRAGDSSGSDEDGYYFTCSAQSGATKVYKTTGGSQTNVISGSVEGGRLVGSKRYMKIHHSAAGLCRIKAWNENEPEPAYSAGDTQADFLSGKICLLLQPYGGTYIFHHMTWATDGDTLPEFKKVYGAVSGDLKLPSGEPAAGYEVTVEDSEGGHSFGKVITDHLGRYFFAGFRGEGKARITARDNLGESWNAVVSDLVSPDFSAVPEIGDIAYSYTTSSATDFDISLPDSTAGDLLIILIAQNHNDYIFGGDPAGFEYITYLQASAGNLIGKALMKVADGTEGATVSMTSPTSGTWSAVCFSVKAGTYVLPRGRADFDSYSSSSSTVTVYSPQCFESRHDTISSSRNTGVLRMDPPWGAAPSLVLSGSLVLADNTQNQEENSFVFSAGSYTSPYIGSTVPQYRLGWDLTTTPRTVFPLRSKPVYSSGSSLSISFGMPLRCAHPPEHPELYHIVRRTITDGTTLTLEPASDPRDLIKTRLDVGDMLIALVYYYGGASITAPVGMTLVGQYGTKLAIYTRIIDGTEVFPDFLSFTFGSQKNSILHCYTVAVNSYDSSGEVIVASGSGASGTSIAGPGVSGDATWEGKNNFLLDVILREGIAGTNDRNAESFPSGSKFCRETSFNIGSSGDAVSYSIAGRPFLGADSGASDPFTMGSGGYPYEVFSIGVKGI